MKVRMRTLSAGPEGIRVPGRVYDVPQEEAEQLIEGHFAEPIKGSESKPAKVVRPKRSEPEAGEE